MAHGARPLRSVRRLSNLMPAMPKWYNIAPAQAGGPTMISIYDEIGFYGVPAAMFLDELSQVPGDIELHLHSPGGDIYEGLAIYNGLLQARKRGNVQVVIDGLAASAASFIAMAASPGQLEVAPHARVMIHDGFCMAIGNAADMRTLADQLDEESENIAGIYADRTGKPAAYWRDKMRAETWYSDRQAVAEGLADRIHGQGDKPQDAWDMSVFANAPANAQGQKGTHGDHQRYDPDEDGDCDACAAGDTDHSHWDADGNQVKSLPGKPLKRGSSGDDGSDAATNKAAAPAKPARADPAKAKPVGPDGWVQDPDGGMRFDPDGDGDDDSTPEGDTDHDYFDEDGKQVKPVPPKPDRASDAYHFPVFDAADSTPWDASKAWHNGATSDDPAKFYAGICAGRRAGDPANQSSWALPYKYHPGDAPNAAGVKNALARLPQTEGLTNADEAKATLQKAMKQVNPDYDPDALAVSPAILASVFTIPSTTVDNSYWDPAAAMAAAAASPDPEAFYRGICAGRRPGDPSSPKAWALPYRYAPALPPNTAGTRAALAQVADLKDLTNPGEARAELEKAMREAVPGWQPEEIDPALLASLFARSLEGAGK